MCDGRTEVVQHDWATTNYLETLITGSVLAVGDDQQVTGHQAVDAARVVDHADLFHRHAQHGGQRSAEPGRPCCFNGNGAWRHRRSRPDQMVSTS